MSNEIDRREVQALTILSTKRREFQKIPHPKEFSESYESCKEQVTNTLTGTQTCIKTIRSYVQTIHQELEAVRNLATHYNIQMGEYLKDNLPKLLNVIWTSEGTVTGTRALKSSDVDLKAVKRQHELQLLAKQQQELMELILDTETFITKVETEAELSIDDFDLIKGSLEKWTDSLETEKERQQREKEELERIEAERKRKEEEKRKKKEREEQERKRKEEEERKRKEEEKRLKEEEERRLKEEKIRRDPQNWKPFIYSRNDDKSSYHKGTTCVVKAMEGILSKSDLFCSASDSNKDLAGCLQGDERLVSSMIDIIHLKSAGDKFEVPIQVYIPCNMPDDSLEVILKVSTGKDTWKIPDTLPTSSFKETPNVKYVGTELISLQHVKLVAVSRFKRDKVLVDKNGHTYESEKDRNMKVLFPPNTFHNPTKVSMKVIPLKGRYLQSARKFHNGLDGIGTPSSLFEISCDDETGSDILMELYGQGSDEDREIYVGSEKLHKRPTKPEPEKEEDNDGKEEDNDGKEEDNDGDEEETEESSASDSMDDMYWNVLKRCESTLVTQLSINDVLNHLKRTDALSLSNSKIEVITSKKTRGDQVREFIKQLSFLGPHAFEAFVESLSKTNQKSLAELIDSKLKEAESKDNSTLAKSKLHVVYRRSGDKWNLMDNVDIVEDSGGVVVRLPSQNKIYELSQSCSHIGAFLFALNDYSRKGLQRVTGEQESCTSVLCSWNVPRKRNIDPQPLSKMDLRKPKYEDISESLQSEKDKSSLNFDPRHSSDRKPDPWHISSNLIELRRIFPRTGMASLWRIPDTTPEVAAEETVETFIDPIQLKCSEMIISPENATPPTAIDDELVRYIETNTRPQRNSQLWKDLHKGRITSSKFGDVFFSGDHPHSLIKQLIDGSNFDRYNKLPASVQWGVDHESKAREEYLLMMNATSASPVTVSPTGLTLLKTFSFLGASSDGLITDFSMTKTQQNGVLEIKCPFSIDNTPINLMEIDDIICNFPSFYVKRSDCGLQLNRKSKYYFQVQGEMAIMGLPWADFVVWTGADKNNIFIERIQFDSQFWDSLLDKLVQFYHKFMC